MTRPKIKAEKRETLGKKVKKLRKQGILPSNLFGKKIKSQALQIALNEFEKVWKEVGESGLIDIEVGEKVHPVLIHNVQIHPVSGMPLHADFHEVSLTEKTTAKVPIELIGESPAVKQNLGVLIQPLSELEVEALPEDLPEKLTIDISRLAEVNTLVTVGDIKVDQKKVKILADSGELVAKIGPLEKEEIVTPPPVGEAAPAEGAPAEGAPTEEGAETPAEEVPTTTEEKPAEEKNK